MLAAVALIEAVVRNLVRRRRILKIATRSAKGRSVCPIALRLCEQEIVASPGRSCAAVETLTALRVAVLDGSLNSRIVAYQTHAEFAAAA